MKYTFLIVLATFCTRLWLKLMVLSQKLPPVPQRWAHEIQLWQQRFNDWPQLNIYRQANASLPPPAVGEHRVIFFGDSITDFWDLAAAFPGQPYLNRGIAGQTTPQMLIRFRPDVIALQPRVVVILAGTNDLAGVTGRMTLEMIQNNYASIAELAQVHQIRVIFASILPVHDQGGIRFSEGRPAAKIQALNQWLQDYCATHDWIYLDYYSHMLNDQGMLRTELSDDGLHPNAKGYAVMAPLAAAAIQQAISQVGD